MLKQCYLFTQIRAEPIVDFITAILSIYIFAPHIHRMNCVALFRERYIFNKFLNILDTGESYLLRTKKKQIRLECDYNYVFTNDVRMRSIYLF